MLAPLGIIRKMVLTWEENFFINIRLRFKEIVFFCERRSFRTYLGLSKFLTVCKSFLNLNRLMISIKPNQRFTDVFTILVTLTIKLFIENTNWTSSDLL